MFWCSSRKNIKFKNWLSLIFSLINLFWSNLKSQHFLVHCKVGRKSKKKNKNKSNKKDVNFATTQSFLSTPQTPNPMAGQPLFLTCDGAQTNRAYFWRTARDSPVTEVSWFSC